MGRNDEMLLKAEKLRWLNNKRVVGREGGRQDKSCKAAEVGAGVSSRNKER